MLYEVITTIPAVITPTYDACNGGTITIDYNTNDACGNPQVLQHIITIDAPTAPTATLPGLPNTLTCAEADAYTSAPDATYTNGETGNCLIEGTIPVITSYSIHYTKLYESR